MRHIVHAERFGQFAMLVHIDGKKRGNLTLRPARAGRAQPPAPPPPGRAPHCAIAIAIAIAAIASARPSAGLLASLDGAVRI